MKGEKLTLDELYAIKTAGGRNSGEKSNALEERFYRDPSDAVEFPAERERRLKRAKNSKNRNRGNR